MQRILSTAILSLFLLSLTPLSGAARPGLEKLEAWPELEGEKGLAKELERLRKARTEAMGEEAKVTLEAAGAGVAPMLLKALGKERDEDALERITEVLDAVTGEPHTRLLMLELESPSTLVRTWALTRVASFPDPGVRPQAEAFLERIGINDKRTKVPQAEVDAAALCATSAGSLKGLELVRELVLRDWADHKLVVRAALEAVRGPAAAERIVPHLGDGERKQRLAALRMLAGCGDAQSAVHVKPLLASSDNTLRVGAINALRGMIDGDPPLEKLPAFEAIELANKWKSRL